MAARNATDTDALRPLQSYATFAATDDVSHPAVHPQDAAWCGSQALLSWVTPLMSVGQRKQLDERDVWPLRRGYSADQVADRFAASLARSKSMARAFLSCFGVSFAIAGFAFLLSMLCTLLGPVVLRRVVSKLTAIDRGDVVVNDDQDRAIAEDAMLWVVLLFVAQVVQALADNVGSFRSEAIAMRFTAAVKTLMFRKSLRLSAAARKDMTTGAITNLFTADCDSIQGVAFMVHQLWLIPLQLAIASVMLYQLLGVASFAGIGMMLLTLYANHWLSTFMFRFQRVYRRSKDIRMKKIAEVFKAVGIVKFNAWEGRFLSQINQSRAVEMKDLFRRRLLVCISVVMLWAMPVFISIATFGAYAVVLHHELTPAIVFTSIALFQLIQGPLRQIANIMAMLVQAKVATERIATFLDMAELDPSSVLTPGAVEDTGKFAHHKVVTAIEDGAFAWDEEDGACLLKNVNMQVHEGDFFVIHGQVGCGKSSLCSALLGEMVKREGTVYVGGSIAYCSQQPWIQNMTIRDNILFGHPFDRVKYDKVVDACSLAADIQTLPSGDLTEIGERGVNLSGGQKARVALARACYSDADIYLLDSPLSAVDAIVQNEIFHKCLLGLLQRKTIILVTHNPEIITSPLITRAVTINEAGEVVETLQIQERVEYEPLVSPLTSLSSNVRRNVGFHTVETEPLINVAEDTSPAGSSDGVDNECEDDAGMSLASPFQEGKLLRQNSMSLIGKSHSKSELKALMDGKLIEEEERVDGHVSRHVFSAYCDAVGGWPVVTVFLMTSVCWQAFQIGGDFWLGAWSSDSARPSDEHPPSTTYRLEIYSLLGVCAAAMIFARMLMTAIYGLRAARKLFDAMTFALLRAPMRFFDSNPIGRILTRYGSDVSVVDVNVPPMFQRTSSTVLSVACSAVTAALVIQWKGLLLLPVLYMYCHIALFYLTPARELQRLIKTTQAPVLTHLSESVDGGEVIRAYGGDQVRRFMATNVERLNVNNQVWYAQVSVAKWFSLRVQLVGSLLVVVVTTSLVLLRHSLGAAVVGLAFSYALKVAQDLERLVQALAQVEPMMVCPERMREYTDIVQEAPARCPTVDPREMWPTSGAIIFDNVSFRYKERGRIVLHDVSFSVAGGEKIGIVGRTGAGKSSLTMALFRINELAGGAISIDGVDISRIGLATLREKLSIIPQNPVLFRGPLRHCLDPFNEFSDDELWAAIRQVGLTDRITSEERKLECQVEENGENFSVGERQMLCMVGALLRQSKIVVFDEATAAIDHETDQKLQRVIRDVFKNSTVLMIAHRLDTILDSDRVLVLDHGRAVQFASPKDLADRGSGHFYELMREGGYLDKV